MIDSTPQTASYYAVRQSNPDVYLPDLVPDGLDADALVGLVREHVEDDWSVPEVEEGPRFRFASRLGLDVPQVRLAVRFLENVVGYWLSSCRKPEARSASACLECSFGEPSEPRDADPDVIADRKRAGVNLHMHLCLTASGATSSRSVNFRQVQGALPPRSLSQRVTRSASRSPLALSELTLEVRRLCCDLHDRASTQ